MSSFEFEAIGTHWNIELFDVPGRSETIEAAVQERIARFDALYSRFRADSLVSRMAIEAGTYALPADGQAMMRLYAELYGATDGAVTPLIGQALSDAGYDAGYSLRPGTLAATPAWQEILVFDDGPLTLKQPALLDFGALGKGKLVDLVAGVLRRHNARSFCVNAGGDMRHHDASGGAVDVALEHPADPTAAIGVARLSNGSLCGSAGNRRAWAGYHHILHPTELASPHHLPAVWVTAATAMLADGLSTALFFAEPDKLRQRFDFEYALVHEDGSLTRSAGFAAEFFV